MKKTIILALFITVAFASGWISSRSLVLKQYPPEAVRFIAETQEFINPMTKQERTDLVQTMQNNLRNISTEFDYQALYEGMSARSFQIALNKGGEPEARELVDRQLRKFQERYDRGLSLPEGSMKLASSLRESIKPN